MTKVNINSPKEIALSYSASRVEKANLTIVKMLLLGILAGMFVALAGAGSTIAQATVASTHLASIGKLLGAAVFPVGLVMILLAGSELFTGNCLIIIPVLQKEIKLRSMLKNWFFVYIGNFIGSMLIALMTAYSGIYSLFDNAAAVHAISIAVTKANMDFGDALIRGILCNFLVCIAVWIAYAAKDLVGKLLGLFMPTMLFVLCAFEHSIANMYFIPTGLFLVRWNFNYVSAFSNTHGFENLAGLGWRNMLINNIIPATIGNAIGGAILVGMVYWFLYLREPPAKAHLKVKARIKK